MICVFTDLKKAFDTVDHQLLCKKDEIRHMISPYTQARDSLCNGKSRRGLYSVFYVHSLPFIGHFHVSIHEFVVHLYMYFHLYLSFT